jgi:hypothetical protein
MLFENQRRCGFQDDLGYSEAIPKTPRINLVGLSGQPSPIEV